MKHLILVFCAFLSFTATAQKKTAVQNQSAVVVSDSAKPKAKGELIRPIKVWKNGASLDAESLDLTIVYDDLESSAKVYYSLKDSTGAQLADGNLDISGADYKTWNTAPNRINWAYNFTIRALRLQQRNQPIN